MAKTTENKTRLRIAREMEFCAQRPLNESEDEGDSTIEYEEEFESVSESELAANIPTNKPSTGIYQSVNLWTEVDKNGDPHPNELENTTPKSYNDYTQEDIDALFEFTDSEDDDKMPELEECEGIPAETMYPYFALPHPCTNNAIYPSGFASTEEEARKLSYPNNIQLPMSPPLLIPETPESKTISQVAPLFSTYDKSAWRTEEYTPVNSTRSSISPSIMFNSPILPNFTNKRNSLPDSVCKNLRPIFKKSRSGSYSS